jgi:hypothetical protein
MFVDTRVIIFFNFLSMEHLRHVATTTNNSSNVSALLKGVQWCRPRLAE